ncbi:MAG: flippase [Bacillus sp. (in: firmicutes)]
MGLLKNYLYNMVYQVVILILPLLTVPYISRVLGSRGVGINAYTFSIASYFILFGTLGMGLYGNRTVAYKRDNKMQLSKAFWGIITLQVITTLTAYILFLIFLIFTKTYHTIFVLQSIFILAAAIDISWLYMGLEDFKKTVIRNLIVRIIGVICIFLFVKSSLDLWKYVLILGVSQLLGQLTMWFYLPKTVSWVKLTWKDISMHLMPAIALFLPQIAIQVYTVLNKTMLGKMANPNEVGYFDNADRLIKIILAVVTALGIVMLPRISNVFAKGDMKKVNDYLYKSFDFVSYLSVPAAFGIAATAMPLAPWFFGAEFTKTGLLICIISPIVVLIAWSGVIGPQFLMPIQKVNIVTLSVCVGAFVNFIVNLILIGKFQSVGTAVSTLIAEFSVTFFQLFWIRKLVDLRKMIFPLWKYFVSGFFMYLVIWYLGNISPGGYKTTLFQIVSGAIIYIALLFILRSNMNQKVFGIAIKKIAETISRRNRS